MLLFKALEGQKAHLKFIQGTYNADNLRIGNDNSEPGVGQLGRGYKQGCSLSTFRAYSIGLFTVQ